MTDRSRSARPNLGFALRRGAPLLALFACLATSAALTADEASDRWTTQIPSVAPSNLQPAPADPPAAAPAPTKKGPSEKGPSETAPSEKGPPPEWIWGGRGAKDGERFYFRKEFTGGAKRARLTATCDNRLTVWLNGEEVARGTAWERPERADVTRHLKPGTNVLLVEGTNDGGIAGMALRLKLTGADGGARYIVSDKSWQASREKDAFKGAPVHVLGKMGVAPWGDLFGGGRGGDKPAPSRSEFKLLPGFQVELLYTVPKETHGSWVSLAFDPQGRLLACDQGKLGLSRITVPPIGSSEPTRVEKLDAKITSAQGMLWAFDSLYLSVNAGSEGGFHRARDTNGDDQFDEIEHLEPIRGGGEHGPHALRLAPDGKSIYLIAGNHTQLPAKLDSSLLPDNWDEDLLLPRQWDARGHARGRLAPGGWIARTDPDGARWELVSSGHRNPYSMDFNADGELFAYDADMEWDMGAPWYRPTRLVHATSGSEFGWRSGTGKWPRWYVDSLPEVVDIGPGSPTGALFGTGAKFPARYQRALLLLDWTFGTIYAIHLEPDGASYRGVKEEFLARKPLPLTDAAIGPDGALYFAIGGRGTQSELFRVTYVGDESTAPADGRDEAGRELRALRRQLESFHARQDPRAVATAWPHLAHADRHIRYAARVALEHQPVAEWRDRVLAEQNPQALITAAVGLARQGDAEDPRLRGELLAALGRIDPAALDEARQLDLLRAYGLVCIRLGKPNAATRRTIAARFDPLYPAASDRLNRELSRLLVYLESPTVIGKTLELMRREQTVAPDEMAELLARNDRYGKTIAGILANQPEIEKVHFALVLRNLRYGWTIPQRQEYFAWLDKAATHRGGASYTGFIKNIRTEALENASPAERAALEASAPEPPPKPAELPRPEGPGHAWTLAEIVAKAERGLVERDFEKGARAYAAARCVVCHRFDGAGGATGPDLTNLAGRFGIREMAEALIEPSKVISDQYRASAILTSDGRSITGRILSETDDELVVEADPEDATKIVTLKRDEIEAMKASPVSLMPKGLVDPLNETELLDLLAYLLSQGNPDDPMFAQ